MSCNSIYTSKVHSYSLNSPIFLKSLKGINRPTFYPRPRPTFRFDLLCQLSLFRFRINVGHIPFGKTFFFSLQSGK